MDEELQVKYIKTPGGSAGIDIYPANFGASNDESSNTKLISGDTSETDGFHPYIECTEDPLKDSSPYSPTNSALRTDLEGSNLLNPNVRK